MEPPIFVTVGRVLAGILAGAGVLLLRVAAVGSLEPGEAPFRAVLPVVESLLLGAFAAWALAEIAHDVRQIRARKP